MVRRRRCNAAALAAAAVCTVTACATKDDGSGGSQSLAGRVFAPVARLFERAGDKETVISLVPPGRYQPSANAIGVEKDFAQNRGRSYGLVRDPRLERYVQSIRQKIERASGVTQIPGSVYLFASEQLDAMSTPDGNILVSLHWLNDVESDDEIAGLLGHEVGHLLLHHHSADLTASINKRSVAYGQVAMATKHALEHSKLSQSDQKASSVGEASILLTDKLAMPAWKRRQEREADLLGVDLMQKAGFNPDAFSTMLERQKDYQQRSQKSEAVVQQEVRELAGQGQLLPALMSAFRSVLDAITASHPDADERLSEVAEYRQRHYEDARAAPPGSKLLDPAKQAARPLLENYRAAAQARSLLLEKKNDEAYATAVRAIRPPTSTAAYPNFVYYLAARATGRRNEALQALNRALDGPEPVSIIYAELSDEYGRQRNYTKALEVADRAFRLFGDDPSWMGRRIRWSYRLRKTKEVDQLVADCVIKYPEYKRDCTNYKAQAVASG